MENGSDVVDICTNHKVMGKILIPTDFSEHAQYALDFASEIALKNNDKLLLIHVVEYPVGAAMDPIGVSIVQPTDVNLITELTKSAQDKIDAAVKLLKYKGVQAEGVVDIGNTYLAVVEKIISETIDLVVMGTHGASGFKEFIIGSNAEKVVRRATCPVISIKSPTVLQDIKKIVFASDFKNLDDNVIMHLKQLQKLCNARLYFVKVNTPNNFERNKKINALIEDVIHRHMFENYEHTVYNDIYEEDGLLNYAQEIKADMIAMATHGRTGIAHLISGSIAEDVVNHAKRPVWTYHFKNK